MSFRAVVLWREKLDVYPKLSRVCPGGFRFPEFLGSVFGLAASRAEEQGDAGGKPSAGPSCGQKLRDPRLGGGGARRPPAPNYHTCHRSLVTTFIRNSYTRVTENRSLGWMQK